MKLVFRRIDLPPTLSYRSACAVGCASTGIPLGEVLPPVYVYGHEINCFALGDAGTHCQQPHLLSGMTVNDGAFPSHKTTCLNSATIILTQTITN